MALFVVTTAFFFTKYFRVGMPGAFQPDVYAIYSWELRIHIAGGIIAALAGLTQFWTKFRNQHKIVHRTLGIVYISSIAISAPTGLLLSTVSQGGFVTHVGFGMLAVLWAYTTFRALFHISRKEVELHKQWMIRSYALTFAFVTLRLWLGVFTVSGVPMEEAYQTVAWVAWVPNLLIVEYVILKKLTRNLRRKNNLQNTKNAAIVSS